MKIGINDMKKSLTIETLYDYTYSIIRCLGHGTSFVWNVWEYFQKACSKPILKWVDRNLYWVLLKSVCNKKKQFRWLKRF